MRRFKLSIIAGAAALIVAAVPFAARAQAEQPAWSTQGQPFDIFAKQPPSAQPAAEKAKRSRNVLHRRHRCRRKATGCQ